MDRQGLVYFLVALIHVPLAKGHDGCQQQRRRTCLDRNGCEDIELVATRNCVSVEPNTRPRLIITTDVENGTNYIVDPATKNIKTLNLPAKPNRFAFDPKAGFLFYTSGFNFRKEVWRYSPKDGSSVMLDENLPGRAMGIAVDTSLQRIFVLANTKINIYGYSGEEKIEIPLNITVEFSHDMVVHEESRKLYWNEYTILHELSYGNLDNPSLSTVAEEISRPRGLDVKGDHLYIMTKSCDVYILDVNTYEVEHIVSGTCSSDTLVYSLVVSQTDEKLYFTDETAPAVYVTEPGRTTAEVLATDIGTSPRGMDWFSY